MNIAIKSKSAIILASAASIFLFAGTAFAEEEICTDVGAMKTIEEAKAAVIKVGFVDVTKMDEEGGCYEAKGLNANGSKFEVYVHPTTLQIVKVKIEG